MHRILQDWSNVPWSENSQLIIVHSLTILIRNPSEIFLQQTCIEPNISVPLKWWAENILVLYQLERHSQMLPHATDLFHPKSSVFMQNVLIWELVSKLKAKFLVLTHPFSYKRKVPNLKSMTDFNILCMLMCIFFWEELPQLSSDSQKN